SQPVHRAGCRTRRRVPRAPPGSGGGRTTAAPLAAPAGACGHGSTCAARAPRWQRRDQAREAERAHTLQASRRRCLALTRVARPRPSTLYPPASRRARKLPHHGRRSSPRLARSMLQIKTALACIGYTPCRCAANRRSRSERSEEDARYATRNPSLRAPCRLTLLLSACAGGGTTGPAAAPTTAAGAAA